MKVIAYYNPTNINIEISEITLLSIEEYEAAQKNIPVIPEWWWLRSPGGYDARAAGVSIGGSVDDFGNYVNFNYFCVRPALRISNLACFNLHAKDTIRLAGKNWTVISEDLILCDESVGNCSFRKDYQAPDANVYEKSDVKKWLENWAAENGIEITAQN